MLTRGLRLEYATLGWNVVGTVVVIAVALNARSVALAGFGLDSLIVIFASVVVVWQLKGVGVDRERRALRLISIAFLILAAYILLQTAYSLLSRTHPSPSLLGTVWLAVTFVAMMLLAWGKQRTGRQIGNAVLMREAYVTLIDAYLAAAVFIGLVANRALGWWWADPFAGLVIVYYAFREGKEALHDASLRKRMPHRK